MPVHTMQELLDLIYKWGQDRNLILGSDPKSQFLKLTEELGEVADEIENLRSIFETKEDVKNIIHRFADGLGDSVVVLTLLAGQYHAKDNNNSLLQSSYFDDVFPEPIHTVSKVDWGKLAELNPEDELFGEDAVLYTDYYITTSELSRWGNLSLSLLRNLSGNIARGKPIQTQLEALCTVLVILSQHIEVNIKDCIQQAYNEIAQRRGIMRDGVFIKEEDLK